MTQAEKFSYEMMDTPTLANEMRLIKDEQRHYAAIKKMTKDDAFAKKEYADAHKRWRAAKIRYNELKKIMQSRQMTMF